MGNLILQIIALFFFIENIMFLIWAISRDKQPVSGLCVCGHRRHVHLEGNGSCLISFGISDKFPTGACCACSIFIEKPKSKPPRDKAADELERMMGL